MPFAETTGIDWGDAAPVLAFLALFLGLHALRRMARRRAVPRKVPRRTWRLPRSPAPVAKRPSVRRLGSALVGMGAVGMAVLAGAAWWMIGPQGESGTPLVGMVTHVRDGDTIEVARRPIRLGGLTCDERGSVLGDRATAAMRGLVLGREVRCMLDGDRTHDREVGRCSLPNGEDLGAMMIASRLCGRCARHDPGRDYAAVQAAAGPFAGTTPGYCRAP